RVGGPQVTVADAKMLTRNDASVFPRDVPQVGYDPGRMVLDDLRHRQIVDLIFGKRFGQHALDAVPSWMAVGADQCDSHGGIIGRPQGAPMTYFLLPRRLYGSTSE